MATITKNYNFGKQFFDNSKNYEFNNGGKAKKYEGKLTKDILKQKVDKIMPLILSKQMYFVVCKYMMWENLCHEGEFQDAIDILEELYPGLGLSYTNIIALNKGSFRKTLDEWSLSDCPFKQESTFEKYEELAYLLMNA